MQTKYYLFIPLFTFNAFASDGLKFSELRVLLMTNTFGATPAALNSLTSPANVDALDTIYGIGIEADARYKWVKIGTRFKGVPALQWDWDGPLLIFTSKPVRNGLI